MNELLYLKEKQEEKMSDTVGAQSTKEIWDSDTIWHLKARLSKSSSLLGRLWDKEE